MFIMHFVSCISSVYFSLSIMFIFKNILGAPWVIVPMNFLSG